MLLKILPIVLLFTATHAVAQNNYVTLDKILNTYQSGKTIDYELTYYFYPNLMTDQASDSLSISIIQKGKQIHMDLEVLEIIQTRGKNLSIDHQAKQMYLQSTHQFSGFSLDQIIEYANTANLKLEDIKIDATTKRLKLTAPNASNTIIELDYHPSTYFLKRTYLRMDNEEEWNMAAYNNTILEAFYSEHGVNRKPFPNNFSDYLVKKNGQYSTQNQYKNYQLNILE